MFLIFVLGVPLNGQAQEKSQTERQQLWSEFKTIESSSWKISTHEATGVPKMLYGGLTKAYSGEPETMARQFLMDYNALFSMKEGLTDLEFVKTQTNRGVHHITFQWVNKPFVSMLLH